MYTTCIHCQQKLGENDAIEALPIGRRVAFDGDKGRLWVVCPTCERWNLTPFDARYEAIEQCERAYRDTRVRLSTDNIGLARLRDGTDLVRIGAPQRPEFAAWRYGDQFGRRRRTLIRNAMIGGGAVIGGGLAWAGVVSTGVLVGAGAVISSVASAINITMSATLIARQRHAFRNPLLLDDGRRLVPTGTLRLIELDVAEGWGLEASVYVPTLSLTGKPREADGTRTQYELAFETVRGNHALPLLRRFLPRVNKSGATAVQVQDGVQLIEAAGGPEGFGAWAVTQRRAWGARQQQGDTGDLSYIPVAARLAFEMAVNEDAERLALQGELSTLEAAWREAEELAHVADALTPMQKIEQRFAALREPRR